MKLKFCNCRMCKRGRKSKYNQSKINNAKGGFRRRNKAFLMNLDIDKLENHVRIIYTD